MIDIYDALEEDIPEIQQLIHQCLPSKSNVVKRLYSEDALKQTLASDNRHLIIAIIDDVIIGVCQYGIPIMDDCDCEDLRAIHAIFVHPDTDFEAVASALIYDVEETINTDANIQRLSLFVEATNLSQIKFYASLGFIHDQVEDSEHEWYMEKDL
ncbi:MAG: GNAT family N-acetyltransferase [Chloroflexota bacterium]